MVEFKYGLFAAFVIFALMIIEYTLLVPAAFEAGYYSGILLSIVPMLLIYPAIKERRDRTNFGYITFQEGFRTGIVITFIVGVIIVIITYVYFEFINKGLVNRIAEEAERNLLSADKEQESVLSTVRLIRERYELQHQIILRILVVLISGLAISAASSQLLKKTKRKKPLNPDQ